MCPFWMSGFGRPSTKSFQKGISLKWCSSAMKFSVAAAQCFDAARRDLETAALLGREFDVLALAQASGRAIDDALESLDAAMRAGLIDVFHALRAHGQTLCKRAAP